MKEIFKLIFPALLMVFIFSCKREDVPVPVAAYTYTAVTDCTVPAQIGFENQSLFASIYRWDFGDKSPAVYTATPTHTFNNEGIYTVELTAYGSGGMHIEQKVVYVVTAPSVTFTVSDTVVTVGDSVNYTAIVAGGVLPATWLWSFGDGFTSSLQNPVHSYSYPGYKSVYLTAVNSCGTTYIEKLKLIRVRPVIIAPVADFIADSTFILTGQSVDFTDLSINNPGAWNWTFQGGTPATSTLKNPQNIVYSNAGSWNVTLTAHNQQGSNTLAKTAYIQVNDVLPAPVADFTGNPVTINAGQWVNFTDNSSYSPTSWSWSFPGGLPSSSTLQNPANITYYAPGNYDVSLTVSNVQGTDTKTKTAYVQVQSFVPTMVYITRITVTQMPFPQPPAPALVNPFYRITDFVPLMYYNGRPNAIANVTPLSLPISWEPDPDHLMQPMNHEFKIELWDKKMMPANDIPIGFVQFNLSTYTSYPQNIVLNQNGVSIELQLFWQ